MPLFHHMRPTGYFTGVTSVNELFDVFGSARLDVILAVLVMFPATVGMTTIATVAAPVLDTKPRLQVTVPADCVHPLPCEGVARTKVTLLGSLSVSVTVGVSGPA